MWTLWLYSNLLRPWAPANHVLILSWNLNQELQGLPVRSKMLLGSLDQDELSDLPKNLTCKHVCCFYQGGNMYVTKDLKPKIAFKYCRISHVLCIICNFIFSCFYFILIIGHIGPAHHALSRYILHFTDKGVATLILVLYIICTGHSFYLVYLLFCSPHLANLFYLICKVDTPIQCLLILFYFTLLPLAKIILCIIPSHAM